MRVKRNRYQGLLCRFVYREKIISYTMGSCIKDQKRVTGTVLWKNRLQVPRKPLVLPPHPLWLPTLRPPAVVRLTDNNPQLFLSL